MRVRVRVRVGPNPNPYPNPNPTQLVTNGPQDLPGARYILRSDGLRIDLSKPHAQKHLQYGYKVEWSWG